MNKKALIGKIFLIIGIIIILLIAYIGITIYQGFTLVKTLSQDSQEFESNIQSINESNNKKKDPSVDQSIAACFSQQSGEISGFRGSTTFRFCSR